MAYLSFMPWTLQKRLLRYLLSQLDFLETDDLNLEDLGITWGQRSIVELNNIGLKTKKLSLILHLPNFVDFRTARISHLKLTVPADILTSGIIVEISGVEVHLQVEQKNGKEPRFQRPEQRKPPAKGTKSNRQRIATPTVHDPGGWQMPRYGPLEDPLFDPEVAAHQLAESFLQTESREDRLELQAAIASQSRHGRESLSSSTMSEEGVGLGAGEGYTLPSFIASYLVGIVDRLQIQVKDVAVFAEFDLSREDPRYQHSEAPTRLLVSLSELCIERVSPSLESNGPDTAKRKVILHQFSVLVLPDPASESSGTGSPEPTSPVLRYSQTSPSISSPALNAARLMPASARPSDSLDEITDTVIGAVHPEETEQSMNLDDLDSENTPLSPSVHTQDNTDTYMNDSTIFAATSSVHKGSGTYGPASPHSDDVSSPTSEDENFQDPSDGDDEEESLSSQQTISIRRKSGSNGIDNQVHAEAVAKSGQLPSDINDDNQVGRTAEDLTESKIFTHDEAESMYMSAVSAARSSADPTAMMPGAWDWPAEQTNVSEGPHSSGRAQSSGDLEPKDDLVSSANSKTSSALQSSGASQNTMRKVDPASGSNIRAQMPQTAKQLIIIDRVTACLPVTHGSSPVTTSTKEPSDKIEAYSSDPIPSRASSDNWDDAIPAARSDGPPVAIEVEVLNVHCQFDMQLGKTLIGLANLPPQSTAEANKKRKVSEPVQPSSSLSLKVSNVEIAFLEHVPELSIQSATTQHSHHAHSLLLSVSIAGLVYRSTSVDAAPQQQLYVTKISMSHFRGQFLSFSHDAKMRTSLKDTLALQKNDLEISIMSSAGTNKVEIHSKPIRLILELGQVDDILSRSGGLSSLLELGSSITSSSTVRTSSRTVHDRRIEPRGVRFEELLAKEPRPQDDLSFGLGKVNLRMGGMTVDIVGSECILKASTSAIKLVHRTEGVGVQIDRASMQGPFILGSDETPELAVNLQNIRMEYLPVPTDKDLDRLLEILTPSSDRYDADDDIMLDTLLRQRRKGAVVRLTVTSLASSLQGTSRMSYLAKVGTELGKLSSVAKYLPEDDRPGILSLGLVKDLSFEMDAGEYIGTVKLEAESLEGAHVNVPSLLAARVGKASIHRNEAEKLLNQSVSYSEPMAGPPMIMCRFVADEMDPTVKIKLFNFCVEYHVPLITALMRTADSFALQDFGDGSEASSRLLVPTSSPSSSEGAAGFVRRINISIAMRDSALALNPRDINGRALFVLTDALFSSSLNDSKDIKLSIDIRKASLMVIDKVNVNTTSSDSECRSSGQRHEEQVNMLSQMGYVPVAYLSSAMTTINVAQVPDGESKAIDAEFGKALIIVESCADSTQTLISILNALSPPAPPAKVSAYRTEIMPIEDLLASFSGDAFITEPGPDAGLRAAEGVHSDATVPEQQDIEYVSEFYQPDQNEEDDISESGLHLEMLDSEIAESTVSISVAPVSIKQSVAQASHREGMANSLLDFREDHFGHTSTVAGTAHRWDSTQNTYEVASDRNIKRSPLKVRIRDIHIIWNLFDGYDWQGTRDIISEAVKDIETRAASRRRRSSRLSPGAEDEEESVIGDFLFNSIYIGISANKDPRELAGEINRDIDDVTSDTGSYSSSTTISGSPARHQSMRPRPKKLKLNRSKQHKMTFELKGVSADMLTFPPGPGEVQSSIDIRVKDLEVFDHIPTSTWKKFATYMRDAGEREADTSMVHIEILNVKPVPDLAASEMILKLTVLPLRLHVDQDALDFMSRFFEFKDESAPSNATPSTPPFLQRVEVNPVKVRLDFKPKRVDYGGLRSGRTTEFMNFFVLDQADMVLRRVILYGVSGFDRLGIMLNNIWTPDVKRNQLPGVLAGLAPIRSLVNVGSGVKDLVVIPMREYKKDGRIVRSIQKGALAFAKTTSKELIGLGAKLAIGTQTVLQNAENMLAPTTTNPGDHPREDLDSDDEAGKKQISLYADQPIGVVQGLRGAYASLERDLLLAKDAIIAVPGEAMASGSAAGAAKAILRQAPTVILRPAIGASKAVGQTLLGVGNAVDRENVRRVEEKYKRH